MLKFQVKRPLIIHTINCLSLGGAELLLKNTLEVLPEFDHLVVYLFEQDELIEGFRALGVELICLRHRNLFDIPSTVIKLNAIIRERKPLLVHSHLFYSTICTRMATPAAIPLISTLHSIYSEDAFNKNKRSLLAARLTLRNKHSLIAVSDFVLRDYLNFVPFKGKRYVLYNFLPERVFQDGRQRPSGSTIKLVAVGNLKEAKNYHFLLQIIKYLKGVSLDIFGAGPQEGELRDYIKKERLNVRLCGSTTNVPGIFRNYDFFIQASSHEGFGLSVIEAMASKIPVLLSDIPVFREISNGFAHFFPLDDAQKAADALKIIFEKDYPSAFAEEAYAFAKDQYSVSGYKEKLLSIYEEITKKKLLSEVYA